MASSTLFDPSVVLPSPQFLQLGEFDNSNDLFASFFAESGPLVSPLGAAMSTSALFSERPDPWVAADTTLAPPVDPLFPSDVAVHLTLKPDPELACGSLPAAESAFPVTEDASAPTPPPQLSSSVEDWCDASEAAAPQRPLRKRAAKRKREELDSFSDNELSSHDAASTDNHAYVDDPCGLLRLLPSQLTPEQQRERKRLKNRIAAHESRQRRKEAIDRERSELDSLRADNAALRAQVAKLTAQLEALADGDSAPKAKRRKLLNSE
eukprot:a174684_2505.p1 GENE.a174684_2505~~a174684_2505.p1  ORF type:complete len:307 (-),score=105.53 a174684_2505:96-893(-)